LELFYRQTGETGELLIILHGLYGSGDNWMSIARTLSEDFQVYLVDQRNHGRSPHSVDMDYDLMAGDLLEFFNKHQIKKANIIGHSMGGKTAMWFATKHPEKVKKLIVVDVAPGTYDSSSPNVKTHKKIISALRSTDPSKAKNRKELDKEFSKYIPNIQLRMFLLKNIERQDDSSYRWRINIDSIEKNIGNIMGGIPDTSVTIKVPTLFFKGGQSKYITEKDLPVIKNIFPDSEVMTIPDAGHWLHASQPKVFVEKALGFLKNPKTDYS